jgi:hypothetical protein
MCPPGAGIVLACSPTRCEPAHRARATWPESARCPPPCGSTRVAPSAKQSRARTSSVRIRLSSSAALRRCGRGGSRSRERRQPPSCPAARAAARPLEHLVDARAHPQPPAEFAVARAHVHVWSQKVALVRGLMSTSLRASLRTGHVNVEGLKYNTSDAHVLSARTRFRPYCTSRRPDSAYGRPTVNQDDRPD